MISKNSFLVLIATFFIAGFICLGLTNKAYSGINPNLLGCCRTGANLQACKGCSGNPPCQQEEEFCQTGNDNFQEDLFCSTVGGGDATCISEAPVGCCQTGDTCTDITEAGCAGDWTFGVMCDGETGSCGDNLPTGCCVVDIDAITQIANEDSECVPDTTQVQCEEDLNGQWTIGGTCDVTLTCLGEGPPPNVISAVPTMSQWGLIATAGLLAFISLFIIIRRHRYNVG